MASRRKHPRRRRPQQRLRQTTAPKHTSTDPPVGWFAQQGVDAVCDGDAPVIAGTRDNLIRILRIHNKNPDRYQIQSTTAAEIIAGIVLGAAYCFDEQAYARFLPPAQAAGLPLKDEDFSEPGPIGVHLVRIGYLPPA